MKVFLPYRGEFGFIIMMHAPQVYAEIDKSDEVNLVCCEPGNEALYPTADDYYHVYHRHDADRRARTENGFMNEIRKEIIKNYSKIGKNRIKFIKPNPKAPRKYFIPEPTDFLMRDSIDCDVVVCPRKREYGSDKNWEHWQKVTDMLIDKGKKVFAAGAPDSSFDIYTNAGRAWDFSRHLDASIVGILKSSLVLATDNGVAHLAVMCGRPLAMIAYKDGLVSPGKDDVGNDYWPIKIERFNLENYCDSKIEVLNWTWDDAQLVMSELEARELV